MTAAVIERDGKVLVARRRPELVAGGLWEFPGGKLEDGESPEQGLERELVEELGVRGPGRRAASAPCRSRVPAARFELLVFRTELFGDPSRLTDHDALRWLAPAEMDEAEFSKPDRPVGPARWPGGPE
ncbi:MAG: NUDIX domain-containing protein [Chromatiales bacterium]|nr:NUDIX domain-containing protein [Chromatiales bacterium]